MISVVNFRFRSGTTADSDGYPTGINKKGFSFSGLPSSSDRKPIGLGVCVRATRPAWCTAANSMPVAMPTDSDT